MTAAPRTLIQIGRPDRAPKAKITLTIDGRTVTAPDGMTIHDVCALNGIDIPTLCYLETLKPVNACRLCMVEVEGSRVLVPSCSRTVENGMVVKTKSDRVKHTRKLVLELLASSVDLTTAPGMSELLYEYDCSPDRFGPPAPPSAAGERDALIPGHHHPVEPGFAATVAQPVKVDNDLYVRDYAKCVLCYKCVEACGEDHQNTFAIAVAGRGFDARISTELAVTLPDSACVYCGNCIAVCPTGALMAKTEFDMRGAGSWEEGRQTTTDTICPYCGVGCTLTLHVQDNVIVKATSPLDNSVTVGNLCIKGRFGWQFVQNGPGDVDRSEQPGERPTELRDYLRLSDTGSDEEQSAIAVEVPVAFIYGSRSHVVMMCTPADFEDLAVGFTLSEEIVRNVADIGDVIVQRHERGVELSIAIPQAAQDKLRDRARAISARTGCGLCGVEAIDDAVRAPHMVDSVLTFSKAALWKASASLDAHQPHNRATHAIHAAAWATPGGELQVVREDVGRHNALDKVLGSLARSGTDARNGFLVVTSRASFELVQKAAVFGVPMLAAVSRPTGLAITIAEAAGMSLVGLLRGRSANIYSHPERVTA